MPLTNHRRQIIHGQLSMIDVLLRGTLYSLSIDRNGDPNGYPHEFDTFDRIYARLPRTSTYTFEASTAKYDDPSLQELLSSVPDAELDDLLEDIHALISSRLRGDTEAQNNDILDQMTRLLVQEVEQKEKKQTGIDIDLS